MFETYVISMIILLVAPLLISILSFPRKKKCSAEEYKLRLKQSTVSLVLIIFATALNIIRSQTSIKLFSYIALALTLAALVYLILSHLSGKKK